MRARAGMSFPVTLTIAGSDSGGGAGIQADLKTFSALNVFGTSALTCVTAQNPDALRGIAPVPAGFTALQIRAVTSAFPVAAAKTGMLFSAAIIKEVAKELKTACIPHLVVDPVAKATSGSSLLKSSAEQALMKHLIPMATVVTPNVPEAEMLCGCCIRSHADQVDAAVEISKAFNTACILKGGHMPGNRMIDVLCSQGKIHKVNKPKIFARETHGTGCTLSAALTAFLASGIPLPQAFRKACTFVRNALKKPVRAGRHFPLGITQSDAR